MKFTKLVINFNMTTAIKEDGKYSLQEMIKKLRIIPLSSTHVEVSDQQDTIERHVKRQETSVEEFETNRGNMNRILNIYKK